MFKKLLLLVGRVRAAPRLLSQCPPGATEPVVGEKPLATEPDGGTEEKSDADTHLKHLWRAVPGVDGRSTAVDLRPLVLALEKISEPGVARRALAANGPSIAS